eukprot:jgi/Picre1/32973/NNA_008300.t1
MKWLVVALICKHGLFHKYLLNRVVYILPLDLSALGRTQKPYFFTSSALPSSPYVLKISFPRSIGEAAIIFRESFSVSSIIAI